MIYGNLALKLEKDFNPPYSIKQWNRDAFAADKYGRNFLGVPPQGRADYAFFQHILKIMKPQTGRCAILFPHGVLSRNDEQVMRKELVRLDLLEAVIGIGKGLFYNSPMEACIIICRSGKQSSRKGKILFINAKDQIIRRNAQSYLDDKHIKRISTAYEAFSTEEGFSYVASFKEVAENNYSLGIPKYVVGTTGDSDEAIDMQESFTDWVSSSARMHESYSRLNDLIGGEEMTNVLLKDVVSRIKDKVDKDNTELKYYIGGEHFETGELTISMRGVIEGSTIGPAFHMRFMPGDVLLMSRNPHLRKAGVVDFEGICSDVSYVCRTKDDSVLLQEFLPFIFQTDAFWRFAEENKKGSTNFFLNWSDFEKYEFYLPDTSTQREMAELLWSFEDTKAAYKKLLLATDELVKSQFLEMFCTGYKEQDTVSVKECCNAITGGNTPSMKHPEYYGGNVPFIKSGDVKTDHISQGALWLTDEALTQTTAKLVPAGAVVVVVRSAALRHEFHAAITDSPVVINQDIKAFHPKTDVLPEYLYWAIKSRENDLLQNVQTMLTSHIETKDVSELRVKKATVAEQKEWQKFVKQSDESKNELKQALDASSAMYKKILDGAFTYE